MADDHVTFFFPDTLPLDQPTHSLIIGKIIAIFITAGDSLHSGWLYKRKQVKIHFSPGIMKAYFLYILPFSLRWLPDHVQLLSCKYRPEAVHSGCTVMITADHHNYSLRCCLCKPLDKTVKHFHCLRRWHCLIIDIPGDHNRIRFFLLYVFCNFPENIFLILTQIPILQLQTYMQI